MHNTICTNSARPHSGKVKSYLEHSIQLSGEYVKHILAFVSWFDIHEDHDIMEPPIEIWKNSFMPIGSYSFIPVVCILHPVSFAIDEANTRYGKETVVITLPV